MAAAGADVLTGTPERRHFQMRCVARKTFGGVLMTLATPGALWIDHAAISILGGTWSMSRCGSAAG